MGQARASNVILPSQNGDWERFKALAGLMPVLSGRT
jgi:hypothetical protein